MNKVPRSVGNCGLDPGSRQGTQQGKRARQPRREGGPRAGAQGTMAREQGGGGIERPRTQDFGASQRGRFNRGNKLKGKNGKEQNLIRSECLQSTC